MSKNHKQTQYIVPDNKKIVISFKYIFPDNLKTIKNNFSSLIDTLRILSDSYQREYISRCNCKVIEKTGIKSEKWLNHHNKSEKKETNDDGSLKIIEFRYNQEGRLFGFFSDGVFFITIIDPSHKGTGQ